MFGFALPQRVFGLDRGDGQHGVRASDRLRSGFRQPEVQHLARVDEFLDRTGDLFDGNVRVDPVLVVEVDSISAQAGR